MKRIICLFSVLFFIASGISLNAQDDSVRRRPGGSAERMTPGLRRQALEINIDSRVLDEKVLAWNEIIQKITMPGSPVGIQLVGSNVILVVQFTPYIRRSGNVLAAQGQIWITDDKNSLTYYTSIQTIPFELGEPLHFLPLGPQQLSPSIEIIITVNPYNEGDVSPETVNVNSQN